MNDDLRVTKQIKNDGWSNLFTGLGTKADKSKMTRNNPSLIIDDMELESIYADDGLGAKLLICCRKIC